MHRVGGGFRVERSAVAVCAASDAGLSGVKWLKDCYNRFRCPISSALPLSPPVPIPRPVVWVATSCSKLDGADSGAKSRRYFCQATWVVDSGRGMPRSAWWPRGRRRLQL
eukprot:349929-Chlamydomonas_euryale.AAC.17